MNSITVYLDESLGSRDMIKLKRDIMAMPHVVDVENPRHDGHDLTIDYEAHADMPSMVLKALRSKGLHPDVISA